ncbi:hypothetical protein ACUNV4_01200 [Granulosicoccus sp. 3-233]|uniref:hypothetical protein n=1 Tax=Granulosicoccus sp. 3-233 TaxID=3417969 RepID=UPI003D327179
MFIPMGTVVAVCMIITLAFSNRIPGLSLNRVTPPTVLRIIGVVTGAAGLWNVLWYGLRHPTEFWGLMALGSGLLMTLLSALLVLPAAHQPALLNRLRPYALIGLLGFAITYVVGIYRL